MDHDHTTQAKILRRYPCLFLQLSQRRSLWIFARLDMSPQAIVLARPSAAIVRKPNKQNFVTPKEKDQGAGNELVSLGLNPLSCEGHG